MLKKTIYLFLSFLFVFILSLLFVEFVLQLIPIVSKTISVKENKVYIYIIGESSSVGEPYDPKISYYKILDYMLDNKIDNKNIEFITIAGAGDSLKQQYWRYLQYRYIHPLKKGLAFIYAGKNDWDCRRNNERYLKVYKSKVFNLIRNTLFVNNSFQYNYEKLILAIRNFGDEIVVATIEGNYAGFMPHLNVEKMMYKEEFSKIDDEILINKN